MKTKFLGKPVSSFTTPDMQEASVEANENEFFITAGNRVLKKCPTSNLEKVLLSKSGGHGWIYFHFSDGQVIELRSMGYQNHHGLTELQLQLRLLIREAKSQERQRGRVSGRAALEKAAWSLRNAELISEGERADIMGKIASKSTNS